MKLQSCELHEGRDGEAGFRLNSLFVQPSTNPMKRLKLKTGRTQRSLCSVVFFFFFFFSESFIVVDNHKNTSGMIEMK